MSNRHVVTEPKYESDPAQAESWWQEPSTFEAARHILADYQAGIPISAREGWVVRLAEEVVKLHEKNDLEKAARKIEEWLHIPTLLLAAGEMTAQERQTCTAVIRALAARVRGLNGKNPTT